MVPPKNQRPYKKFRNFKNLNEGQFLEELNTIPWDYVNQFNDPNDSLDHFSWRHLIGMRQSRASEPKLNQYHG